jgi:hypothetical protein
MLPEKRISFPSQAQGFACRGSAQFNFSVERMAAGGTSFQIRALVARRHRSPWRSAAAE